MAGSVTQHFSAQRWVQGPMWAVSVIDDVGLVFTSKCADRVFIRTPKHCVAQLCPKHYVSNTVFKPTTRKHCVQHSVSAHKRSTKLCDECAPHIVKMCDAYSVVIVGLNGAQGRNRTTDTRIFKTCVNRKSLILNDYIARKRCVRYNVRCCQFDQTPQTLC